MDIISVSAAGEPVTARPRRVRARRVRAGLKSPDDPIPMFIRHRQEGL
jgi:hypothetical protein